MQIPPFMLKKIYQGGSLRNTPAGVALVLKNAVAPAHVTGIDFVRLGGDTYRDNLRLRFGGRELGPGDLSPEQPLFFGLGQAAELVVGGVDLAPGTYPLAIAIRTREVGPLVIETSDTLGAG